MKLRLIRHATLWVEIAGQTLLIDPLLADPQAYRSLTVGSSAARNPTAPLPCSVESLLHPDFVLVTHTHFDHFDTVASEKLPKHRPLICQPADQPKFVRMGFSETVPVNAAQTMPGGLQFIRTQGNHGKGGLGRAMGQVSGFVIKADQEPTLYVAGDTVWGPPVQAALHDYHPDIVVLNAGAARFNLGGPITMTAEDVAAVCRAAPDAVVIAVHMEAINHCRLKRADLASALLSAEVSNRVCIPQDGELVTV